MYKLSFAVVLFVLLSLRGGGQDLRSSFLQYQFNALPINPAYAGSTDLPGFEAVYFGNFVSDFQVARSVLLSLHGASARHEKWGWGGVARFQQQDDFSDLSLQPAVSRALQLPNGDEVAFGAMAGLSYFDVNELAAFTDQQNFSTLNAGVGVLYIGQKSFIGLSAIRFFEKPIARAKLSPNAGFVQQSPFSLHAGTAFRLAKGLELKPALLLQYINVYGLPDRQNNHYVQHAGDFLASVVVERKYVVGLLVGRTNSEQGGDVTRAGITATYFLGNLHLGYAIQHNNLAANATSLPVSHLLSAGYDFGEADLERPVRYF